MLALRKHAEHQQLSLPAAGPKGFPQPLFLDPFLGGGGTGKKKCSEQVKSSNGQEFGFSEKSMVLNQDPWGSQEDQAIPGTCFPSNNPPDVRPPFALGLPAGLCHVSERNAYCAVIGTICDLGLA